MYACSFRSLFAWYFVICSLTKWTLIRFHSRFGIIQKNTCPSQGKEWPNRSRNRARSKVVLKLLKLVLSKLCFVDAERETDQTKPGTGINAQRNIYRITRLPKIDTSITSKSKSILYTAGQEVCDQRDCNLKFQGRRSRLVLLNFEFDKDRPTNLTPLRRLQDTRFLYDFVGFLNSVSRRLVIERMKATWEGRDLLDSRNAVSLLAIPTTYSTLKISRWNRNFWYNVPREKRFCAQFFSKKNQILEYPSRGNIFTRFYKKIAQNTRSTKYLKYDTLQMIDKVLDFKTVFVWKITCPPLVYTRDIWSLEESSEAVLRWND